MTPTQFLDGRVIMYPGDCLEVLVSLPENSIDSIVTDPPYGLEFMGKEWDGSNGFRRSLNAADVGRNNKFGRFSAKCPEYRAGILFQSWCETWARECLRVLKPGGHMLAFGSSRTYHRLAVAIEDGGFEIRDCIMWVYGSGFPKSHDISKAIDRMAGAEREVLGVGHRKNDRDATSIKLGRKSDEFDITAPATEAARQWQGFGTALKPAVEPICVARKPLSERSIAANVLKHGTGAINIDGCRIGTEGGTTRTNGSNAGKPRDTLHGGNFGVSQIDAGRWPANLIHDGSEEVLAGFPETTSIGHHPSARGVGGIGNDGHKGQTGLAERHGDSGSAARFFYTAKADAEDRIGSKHPTVKPISLVRYLARLVTPPGGTILDPFAGTGTLGEAAYYEGFNAILIEREPEYQADIARRMDLATKPTKRAAVAKSKNNLQGAEGTPLFGDVA